MKDLRIGKLRNRSAEVLRDVAAGATCEMTNQA